MSHTYDSKYTRPMPALPVILHNSENGQSVNCKTAYLDTGADGTIVPQALLEEIGAEEIEMKYMQNQWGERRDVSIYSIDIEVDGEYLSAIDVVSDQRGNEILLGRNVLNHLIIQLDGLKNQANVLTRRPQKF